MYEDAKNDVANVINNCFVDVLGRLPADNEVRSIGYVLPDEIMDLAAELGWYATTVRDKLTVWVRENKLK